MGWKMAGESLNKFFFRDLHPNVFIGTTTDRYAGWTGQIYSRGRYEGKITRRDHIVGGKKFVEEVLPIASVEDYFEHFSVLEVDYTFYRLLVEKDGTPTQNYHVLKQYRQHLTDKDYLVPKVPQVISSQKLRRGAAYLPNEAYLSPEIFTRQFYKPAVEMLGPAINGFIFEQEYQKSKDRLPSEEVAKSLDTFFQSIPTDERYHVELRTEAYLTEPVFAVLQKYGVGQVLSHWTWLPGLRKQFEKSGGRFFNSGKQFMIRLITPVGMKYEIAYEKAHPFDKMVEGMLQPAMVKEAAELMRMGIEKGMRVNVLINNRAGGNAPMIAQKVAEEFLAKQ
jgi:uncharacterized protein YecE (DUF72 family)